MLDASLWLVVIALGIKVVTLFGIDLATQTFIMDTSPELNLLFTSVL